MNLPPPSVRWPRQRPDTHPDNGPTCHYRYYDFRGVFLYTGITNDLLARDWAHYTNAPWYKWASSGTYRIYPTRAMALRMETVTILVETPVYNRDGAWPIARDLRVVYEAQIHTTMTVSNSTHPAYEFHLTCGLCPRWEAWAGNHHEAERWRDEHIATAGELRPTHKRWAPPNNTRIPFTREET